PPPAAPSGCSCSAGSEPPIIAHTEEETMTWQAVVTSVALLALPVAACGREDTGVTPPAPTTQELSDALLAVGDLGELGTGWTETQRDVFSAREPENPSIDPSLWCPAGKGTELVTLAGPAGADVELNVDTGYIIR